MTLSVSDKKKLLRIKSIRVLSFPHCCQGIKTIYKNLKRGPRGKKGVAKDIRGQSTVARETTKVIQLLIIGFQINMVEIWTTTFF